MHIHKEDIIIIVYVDDGILITKKNSSIDINIKQLKERYKLTDEGIVQD